MDKVVYVVMLVVGGFFGYFAYEKFGRGGDTEKIHVTLSEAVSQSKFNLVREDYIEQFYLCEEGGLRVNNWKALVLMVYRFQYGVDGKDIKIEPLDGDIKTATKVKIYIDKVESISSENPLMKVFTIDSAWFKNEQKLISESQSSLVSRAAVLGRLRVNGNSKDNIHNLVKESVKSTVSNLALAVGREIIVKDVVIRGAANTDKVPEKIVKYQCGDITPIDQKASAAGVWASSGGPVVGLVSQKISSKERGLEEFIFELGK